MPAVPFWSLQRTRLIVIAAVSASLGLGLVLGMRALEPRWLACIALAFCVLWAGIVSRRFERFMLMLLFLAIPVNIDINFDIGASLEKLYLPTGTPRLGISIMDMTLLILYPIWISRLIASNSDFRKINWPAGSSWFWAFMGWGMLSLLVNAPNFGLGMALWIGYLRVFLLFFYAANNIRKREDFWLIAWCISAGLLLESLICLAQKAAGGNLGLGFLGERAGEKEMAMGADTVFRIGGTQGHPNALGGYLVSVLPVALALCLASIQKWKRVILSGIFVLGLLVLFLSYSRSAWFMGFLGCVIMVCWAFYIQRKNLKKILPALILGGFITAGLAIAFGPYIKNRLEQDDKGSTLSRIPQWQMALSMVKSHPILGVGMNNYNMVTEKYETYVEDPTSHSRVFLYAGRPHNVFIGVAAEVGIPGLLLVMAFFMASARYGLKEIASTKDELTRLILIGMFLGFLMRMPHDAFHTGTLNAVFYWLYPACMVSKKDIP